MKIKNLSLKNIGPFIDAHLDFITDKDTKSNVVIITGENGTGKTIVLDAIRWAFYGSYSANKFTRNIIRDKNNFSIAAKLTINNSEVFIQSIEETKGSSGITTNQIEFNSKFSFQNSGKDTWVVNYWTSKTSNEDMRLYSLVSLEPKDYLLNALSGVQSNVDVLKLITAFDYYRSSDNPKEKAEGNFLYEIVKKIITLGLIEGELKYVERKINMPIVSQNGFDVSLDKLSSGNLYLIQRMISLLGQMYSVYELNNLKLQEMLLTPGLLLIDEAENHLHPKWQKTFLNSILDIFPNLQIIVTTHSPFIVSSVENAKIFVCKSMKDHSTIEDETDLYSNKPIEEILLSDVFNTSPFGSEITGLLSERKIAIDNEDFVKREQIELKLKTLNPEYFSYFDVDKLIQNISK
jgi:predicted ATP-binding protein involved in virulence